MAVYFEELGQILDLVLSLPQFDKIFADPFFDFAL